MGHLPEVLPENVNTLYMLVVSIFPRKPVKRYRD